MKIYAYKLWGEKNRVDKSGYMNRIHEYNGTLRDEINIVNPVIRITLDSIPDFNYLVIPDLGDRWYFVDSYNVVRNNVYDLELSIDVLMTYKNAINNIRGFVERNEFTFNNDIIDKKRVIEQGVDVEVNHITNSVEYVRDFVISGLSLYIDPNSPISEGV